MSRMRKRSESFYAKNEEEFKEIFNPKNVCLSERKKRKEKRCSVYEEARERYENMINFNYYDDLDMDQLGVNKTFELTCVEDTPETAETELITNLNNLNQSLKTKDKQMFLDNICQLGNIVLNKQSSMNELFKEQRRHTFDSLGSIEINFKDPLTLISTNSVLAKNIDITDSTLKLMVIGDEKAGKTYFIQRLLNYKMKEYTHTKSLEIFKKQIKLLGNYVCLELWDTNLAIINSDLFGFYQKLSDGVILVIDADKPSSAYFIYELLSKIEQSLLCQDKTLFVVCNKRERVFQLKNSNSLHEQTYEAIQKIIKDICINVYYVDYEEEEVFENVVNRLISITYLKKGTGYLYSKGSNKSMKKIIKKQISTPEIPKIGKYSYDLI